jgi:hypothetical protein
VTKEQAVQLAAQIEHDYAGRLQATPEVYRNSNRLHLLLVTGQRTVIAYSLSEWESWKQAWSAFLPDLQEEVPAEKPPKVYYLVDGIPMTIYLEKNSGKWKAQYSQDGKQHKKYLGRVDPRPNYPIYQEEKAS